MQTEDQSSSSSDVCCILCKRTDETEITGPLSCKEDTTAHQNCLLYASGIYCKHSPSFDDLFGFDVEDVKKEARRGKKLKCCFCNKTGATSGCEVKSCKQSYHVPCAHKAKAVLQEDTFNCTFKLYCVKHNPNNTDVGSKKGGGKEKDAKIVRFSSDHKLSKTNKQDSSPRRSDGNNSDASRRSQGRKRTLLSSDSEDETQDFIDMEMAPIESDSENNTLPKMNTHSAFDPEHRSTDHKKQRQECAFTDEDSDSESLLTAYRQDRVPFIVIADSGPSVESVAENSPDPFSSAPTSPAGAFLSNVAQSPACASAALPSSTTVSPNPHVLVHPCLTSSPSSTTSESSRVKESMCKNVLGKIERCSSRNEPPLQMSLEGKLPGSHKHLHDCPLDLTSPGGCCTVHSPINKTLDHLDSDAAHFWRRCNEVGCTEDIFSDLTRQLSSLAEKVKNQHATQQDYAVSLRILEASGRLPTIFKQMEQDFENQERQLQKKKQALKDAKAVLQQKQFRYDVK